jgi:predicted small lipoprotein YifL
MRAHLIIFMVLLATASLLGLSACGKRGDLYLPTQSSEQ